MSPVYEEFHISILSPETSAQPLNNKCIADCQTSVGRYFGVSLTLLKSGKVFAQVLHCISTEGLAAHQARVCSLTADNNAIFWVFVQLWGRILRTISSHRIQKEKPKT